MNPGRDPDLKRALRPVPSYERAVREISRMLSEAGIRHALVGVLAANAYRSRPRTTAGSSTASRQPNNPAPPKASCGWE